MRHQCCILCAEGSLYTALVSVSLLYWILAQHSTILLFCRVSGKLGWPFWSSTLLIGIVLEVQDFFCVSRQLNIRYHRKHMWHHQRVYLMAPFFF